MAGTPDREPLFRYLETQALTDQEIRRIMSDAANLAEKELAAMGSGVGRDVRQAQLAVAQTTQNAWRSVGDASFVGIGDAADAAGESLAYLNGLAFDSVGINQAYWREAMLQQAREGVEAIRSRKVNGIGLSDRVYKNRAITQGHVDRMINAGLANGTSARSIANSVKDFIHPGTPGGAGYAAMRLGRSEVNNAYHTTSMRLYQDQPWIEGVKWSLSRSHSHADQCNEYAGNSHFRGGDAGVFKPESVPDKPHPQCFCYISPVTISDDELIKRFNKGQYDDYAGNMGCSRG